MRPREHKKPRQEPGRWFRSRRRSVAHVDAWTLIVQHEKRGEWSMRIQPDVSLLDSVCSFGGALDSRTDAETALVRTALVHAHALLDDARELEAHTEPWSKWGERPPMPPEPVRWKRSASESRAKCGVWTLVAKREGKRWRPVVKSGTRVLWALREGDPFPRKRCDAELHLLALAKLLVGQIGGHVASLRRGVKLPGWAGGALPARRNRGQRR